jgi:hypothetical protein
MEWEKSFVARSSIPIITSRDNEADNIYPIQFIERGEICDLPAPLVRLSTCGGLTIEVLEEVVSVAPPQARYRRLSPDNLRGRGIAPALTFLKLLASQSRRYAKKDFLREHLSRLDEEAATDDRVDDVASLLRGLLYPSPNKETPEERKRREKVRKLLVVYVHGSKGSGGGFCLGEYPLIWVDTDALAHHITFAARMDRFRDPNALPSWERAYQLASSGPYLPDELYSDWANGLREEVEGYLRQSVHALSRLYLACYGEAGEEELQIILRNYWLAHKTDEDVLRPLMELLGKQERYGEALDYYTQLEATLAEHEPIENGKAHSPDERTHDIHEYLRTKQIQRPTKRDISVSFGSRPTLNTDKAEQIALSPLATTISQGIILAVQELGNGGVYLFSAATSLGQRRNTSINFAQYERNIRNALQIHRTSSAQSLLRDLNNDIDELEILEDQVEGDMLSQVKTLLIANDLLATKIVKDQKQYALAYAYANHAVRVAKGLSNEAFLATARYTRGCTKLEWGLFGGMRYGQFQQDTKKIQNAIHDFQEILTLALRQPDALHPQLHGSTQLQFSRAQLALKQVLTDRGKENALQIVDQVAGHIGHDPIDDPLYSLDPNRNPFWTPSGRISSY